METTDGGGKQQVLNSLSRVLHNMNMSAILGGQAGTRTSFSASDGAEALSSPPSAADADASIVKKGYLKKYKVSKQLI